ncbi:MAG: 23S rRNA (adenine(2030)-N(6))-methyltransferase RlmJ [Burkholderiales bacterium]|nr:23S rRNA (adenine(2030)-N(6))-methyltransferase RlmJ [Burkholderiales bacterium]MDE2456378.1 23S rRNA (adenine(2030)-N(6))-methyltransferase RlmJ [Burkholderiales bacterium]
MLAYRHAFHAGNHADVLKHVVLVAVLRYMALKEKGFRLVDTHAGAGGYSLEGRYAQQGLEFENGIARLMARDDLPPAVADYVELVRRFNSGAKLAQYPGSPALAQMLLRNQDQMRLYELHPTEHKILASFLGATPGVEVHMSDGFGALKSQLPPPTRRAVVLIDPPYELAADYAKTLAALREALERFPEAVVIVWMPQLQKLEAAQLPKRLEASAQSGGRKGWLLARLTLAHADARGFGMLGSSVFVANPPHTLAATLQQTLPWLAEVLAQTQSQHALERSAGG